MAENILHFGGTRIRVNGSGELKLKWIGLDDVATETLKPLIMSEATGRSLTRLSNFKGQRARLKISVDGLGQHFAINRVVLYVKELYTSYPQ